MNREQYAIHISQMAATILPGVYGQLSFSRALTPAECAFNLAKEIASLAGIEEPKE